MGFAMIKLKVSHQDFQDNGKDESSKFSGREDYYPNLINGWKPR
jgi:hypothetical protein